MYLNMKLSPIIPHLNSGLDFHHRNLIFYSENIRLNVKKYALLERNTRNAMY